jgi:glycosyltransferase involved in cell wall biosynthesis
VIPNFVEPFETDPPRPGGVPERYALFVGKLEPSKAPDRLHAILDAARANIPLLVAGAGKLESSLKAKGGDVRYLGWVEEERTLALVRHADCLVFPSRWEEPLARVLLDALALGAVIVAEPTGGTEEMIVDGESGLLGRGAAELGRALRRVLDDPILARRLREGARRRAAAVFSEEAVLPRVEALYQSVAER